jgi:hypothetical protein
MGLRIVIDQAACRFTARSIIDARTNNFAHPIPRAIRFLLGITPLPPGASSISSEATIRSGDVGVHGESKGNTISPLYDAPQSTGPLRGHRANLHMNAGPFLPALLRQREASER